MKIQVRQSVFETNSSSTHSLSTFNKNDWERFKKGEMVISNYPETSKLIDINEIDKNKIYVPSKEHAYWEDYDFYLYKDLDDVGLFGRLVKEHEDIVIMSVCGDDY